MRAEVTLFPGFPDQKSKEDTGQNYAASKEEFAGHESAGNNHFQVRSTNTMVPR